MKNIKIKLPTSLKEIKIGHLQHLAELETIYKEPFELLLQKVSYLSGHSITELRKVKTDDLMAIDFSWLNITTPDKVKPIESFKLKGTKYMRDDLGNETGGMHLDFLELSKEPMKNAHVLVAMLYRPCKNVYSLGKNKVEKPEDYNLSTLYDRANLFRNNLPADIFPSIISFFLSLQKVTLSNMLVSLEKLIPTLPESEKKTELIEKMSKMTSFLNTLKSGDC